MESVKKRDQRERRAYRLTRPNGQEANRKLTPEQVHEIRFGNATFEDMEARFGVSRNAIWGCSMGQTYKDLPMNPERPNGRKPNMFSVEQIKDIRRRLEAGEHATKIAELYNCGRTTIGNIKARKIYKWVR